MDVLSFISEAAHDGNHIAVGGEEDEGIDLGRTVVDFKGIHGKFNVGGVLPVLFFQTIAVDILNLYPHFLEMFQGYAYLVIIGIGPQGSDLVNGIDSLHQRKDAVFRSFGIDAVFPQTVIDVVKIDKNAYIFRRRIALLHTCFQHSFVHRDSPSDMILDRLRKRKIHRCARIWLIELEYQRTGINARIFSYFCKLYVTVQPSLAAAQPGTFVSWTYNVES